jgi:hypothetical protein
MKTIVRVEHYVGDGLWKAKDNNGSIYMSFSFVDDLVEKHYNFPTPNQDLLLSISLRKNPQYYCAFKSIEQLQQWIDKEWWKEIFELGFKVLLIDVSECLEGEYQILYQKQHILQSKDISNLFKP